MGNITYNEDNFIAQTNRKRIYLRVFSNPRTTRYFVVLYGTWRAREINVRSLKLEEEFRYNCHGRLGWFSAETDLDVVGTEFASRYRPLTRKLWLQIFEAILAVRFRKNV